jgi:hypothetical protein
MMDSIRRKIPSAGTAATTMAAALRGLAQPAGQAGTAASFYEKGDVRIRSDEIGSGFPLLVIPGGGLNSRIGNWTTRCSTRWRLSRMIFAASHYLWFYSLCVALCSLSTQQS